MKFVKGSYFRFRLLCTSFFLQRKKDSCSSAAARCGNDVVCIRDRVVDDHKSGRFSFCPWSDFDLLINPYPGYAAYYGYNGATVWNDRTGFQTEVHFGDFESKTSNKESSVLATVAKIMKSWK